MQRTNKRVYDHRVIARSWESVGIRHLANNSHPDDHFDYAQCRLQEEGSQQKSSEQARDTALRFYFASLSTVLACARNDNGVDLDRDALRDKPALSAVEVSGQAVSV